MILTTKMQTQPICLPSSLCCPLQPFTSQHATFFVARALPVSSLAVPEGRTGTTWEISEQWTLSLPSSPKNNNDNDNNNNNNNNNNKWNWRIKNQLDATYYFIVLLIGSTCFGHDYAHHQELATIMLITTLVVLFLVFCRLEVRCG